MGLRHLLRRSLMTGNQRVSAVPKGYCAVYVGENQKKRYVIPVTYLNQPCLQDLLSQATEEFDYYHPMGGLTFHCKDDNFTDLISQLNERYEKEQQKQIL